MKTAIEEKLKPLRRKMGALWILGWALCVISLGLLALFLKRSLDQKNLDAQLSIYATATYGLAWFDENGAFHPEHLLLDSEIVDAPFDIWIVQPGSPAHILWQPSAPQFARPNLEILAEQVLSSDASYNDEARTLPASGLRLQTAQIFESSEQGQPLAAVLVIGDPNPLPAWSDPFVQRLAAYCLLLLLGGFGLGLFLAQRNLQPVVEAFQQRENFLAAAAHELRTPLATLKSIAESASCGDEPAQDALASVNRLASTTSRVVDDLLLYAQLDAGTAEISRQRVRLDLLIEAATPEDLDLHIEGGEIEVEVDPNLFAVLVRNLFANATGHGNAWEKGVRIQISANRLVFQDAGPGFPEKVLSQVRGGQTFVSSRGGIGLGLTILHLIAKQHHGEILLSNASEGGARFEFRNF